MYKVNINLCLFSCPSFSIFFNYLSLYSQLCCSWWSCSSLQLYHLINFMNSQPFSLISPTRWIQNEKVSLRWSFCVCLDGFSRQTLVHNIYRKCDLLCFFCFMQIGLNYIGFKLHWIGFHISGSQQWITFSFM